MQTVEAFVLRSRREAEESIEALTKEAETLRARLQKVEAALERWKAVRDGLIQGAAVDVKAEPQQLEPIPGAAPQSGGWQRKSASLPAEDPPVLVPPPELPGVKE